MKVSFLLLGLMQLLIPNAGAEAAGARTRPEASSQAGRIAFYSHLPLSFEPNQGQTDPQVKFLARGPGYTLFLASDEAVLTLQGGATASPGKGGKPAVVRLKLVGAERNARVSGERELAGRSNYFVGNDPQRWHTHIPTYGQVRYRDVYRGIDLVYYGRQGQLEYDFVVAPGAEAKAIGFEIVGAEGAGRQPLRTDSNGELVIATDEGEVRFHRPEAYQWRRGVRRQVAARYEVLGERKVRFKVGDYDRSQPLIIDPVLRYSTYLGGSGGDVAYGIAVDNLGNAYVVGTTGSLDFPLTSAVQTENYGIGDVFVAKLNPTGTGLIYSTYLGGGGQDIGTSIAIDSSGSAYIAGYTYSPYFPVTTNIFQSDYAGNGDGFIAKLDASGSTLIYASYIGGSDGLDVVQAVAVDSSGNAYLTGSTQSTDFPVVNFQQIGNAGAADVFVAKVSPSGSSLIYSTYLGGSGADLGQAIAVDGTGNVYLAGTTYSSNFPTQSAFQGSSAGGADVFVTELDAAGTALIFSTYFGGSGNDRVFGMAVDANGSVYITGDTYSADFPTTSNALQIYNRGKGDVFVARFNPGGWGLVYSTLLGGTDVDEGNAVALDSAGNAYVTGFTRSADFPLSNPLQQILGLFGASSCEGMACADAFVLKLRSSGELVYSTYLGGSGSESGWAIAVDSSDRVYLAGSTTSGNFPAIAGAAQGEFAGNTSLSNAFVARIDDTDLPGVALNPQQINFGNQALNQTSDPLAVKLINAGSAPLTIDSISATGDFAQTNNCGTTVPAVSGTCTIQITFTPTTLGTRTDQITITDNAEGSPHQIGVTGTGISSSMGSLTITPTSVNFPYEPVGETSPAQVVYIMNTSKAAITLTDITISGDFDETDTCGNLPSILNAGDSCSVSIIFTPTQTGKRTGTLTIASNAAGGNKTVSLAGIGNAVFALSISSRATVIQIGKASSTKPTYTISASAASSFTDSIALSCSASSGATCTFDPTSIKVGETSTLTVSGLSATSNNPLNITASGSSGGQTATVGLTIFFSDFTLDHVKPDPALRTITAGQDASYTITVTPSNNFDGVVLLSCSNLPAETDCSWSPSAVWVNGSEVTAKVTVETTTQQSRSVWRRPAGPHDMLSSRFWLGLGALWLAALGLLGASILTGWRGNGPMLRRLPIGCRLAALGLLLVLPAVGFGCNSYYSRINVTPASSGTPSGNYTIVVTGTLGNNNNVTRTTTFNLSVGSG
jgi:hypothetical protein